MANQEFIPDNNVRKIRLTAGISQTRLSLVTGIPISRVSMVERGSKCNQATAAKIAAALNEKPETVFPNFSELRGW